MQKSIEDLDASVKENKDDIITLGLSSRSQNTEHPEGWKIKELTDKTNNMRKHQRNFSIHINGLHVSKEYKNEAFLKYVYTQAIQLKFGICQAERGTKPEY